MALMQVDVCQGGLLINRDFNRIIIDKTEYELIRAKARILGWG